MTANWEGLTDPAEHRTVGPHRAWHYPSATWCYPDDLCPSCDQSRLPECWRGLNTGDVLGELRAQVNALVGAGGEQRGRNFRVFLDDVLDLIDGVESAEPVTR